MANDDVPRGLVPINFNPKADAHYYRVSSATDIFQGQIVLLPASGYVALASNSGIQNILGVAVGFSGSLKRGTATDDPYLDVSDLAPLATGLQSGDRWVLVADDPNQEFMIQEDTGGTALALADAGAAFDVVYRNPVGGDSGNTTTGFTHMELDRSTIVTTTAATLQLLRLADIVNTDGTENAVGNFGKWIVKFITHQHGGAANAAPIV